MEKRRIQGETEPIHGPRIVEMLELTPENNYLTSEMTD